MGDITFADTITTIDQIKSLTLEQLRQLTYDQIDRLVKQFGSTEIYFAVMIFL